MIFSFSQLGKYGRLGNQLFQVASTLGLAEKYQATAAFPPWEYEQFFDISLPHGEPQTNVVKELYFHHFDWNLKESCDLLGYMQSEKYFGSTRLKIKREYQESARSKYPSLFEKKTICIHIRKGDYVGNRNYHQIPATWYTQALLKHFPNWKEYNILFVSDDIEYCRVHFSCMPNAYFTQQGRDIEDMILASCCDHFIISNSSFGWWCAWLGEKKHSKIVHCGKLHAGPLLVKDARDYYPKRWIEYQRDDCRLDLTDVTFTIPIFLDSPDRKKNMDLSLCLLMRDLDTNYIVCEQGGGSFSYTSQWAKYVQETETLFHRTKMLNHMARMATTPYIVNWDCDIFIPPTQLYLAADLLRAGGQMVFPYDGGFARMPRHIWFPLIQKSLDIGVVGNTPFKGRRKEHNSVGGAVMWNKEAFIDGGMENEHMISFGPEDAERHDRFKKLGYKVERVEGPLFHMDHFIGINSSKRHPNFKDNWHELGRIRTMSSEELRAYVNTWPWKHA